MSASGASDYLLFLFPERVAEGMRWVDAKDGQLLGKKGELLEREHQRAVVRVALDVGIELRGEEIAANHVALELGHVDAVGGEAAHRLVERRWHVAYAEHEGRDDLALAGRCPFLLAREHDEARGRIGFVLDVLAQDVETIDLRGQTRGDGRARDVLALGYFARGTGGVGSDDRLQFQFADDLA